MIDNPIYLADKERLPIVGDELNVQRVAKRLGLYVQTIPVVVRNGDVLLGVNDVRIVASADGRLAVEIVADSVRPVVNPHG